jgi:Peptidase family M28
LGLRDDVEALCARPRDSAGEGERWAAGWLAGRLREAGAQDVEVEPFRYAPTYAWSYLLHAALGLTRLRWVALALYELEASGRAQPLRALLPKGEGANVMARVPARGERRRTVVYVAHHDAARTGLMWHPAITRARGSGPAGAGLALAIALGATRTGRALLALAAVLLLDVARNRTVPGANDNASGVAALIALAERLAADPPQDCETLLVSTGCEESGMGGMRAFLQSHPLDPATTFVLGLDTLGSGEPVVLTAESTVLPHRYRPQDVARVDARPVRIGTFTDAILARFAGLPAASLLSLGPEGSFTNYHVMTDTPDRVDYECVERCVATAERVARVG